MMSTHVTSKSNKCSKTSIREQKKKVKEEMEQYDGNFFPDRMFTVT